MKTSLQTIGKMLAAGFLAGILTISTLAQVPSPEELAALNTGVGKAIDAHDVGGIVSYNAPDAVFDFVPAPPVLTGTNAIAGFFAGLFQGFPDYTTTSEQRWISGNIVVTAHTTMATLNGAWMGLPATGKGGPHMHVDIWEYQGDKIQRTTTYADMQSIMVTVGLMAATPLPALTPSFALPDPEPIAGSPLEVVLQDQAVWNAHDLAAHARHLHADARMLIAPLGTQLDRSSYIAVQELYLLSNSKLQLQNVRSLELNDRWVASEVVFTGISDGPYFGLPPTGRAIAVRALIMYQVGEDGLIHQLNVYWDNITLHTQMGLIPPPLPQNLVVDEITSPSLEGNRFDDPATRKMLVYLPPSYASSPERRYPVVYLLHGYSGDYTYFTPAGTPSMFSQLLGQLDIQMDIGAVADSLIASGQMEEMILVMPDAFNAYGGSWYERSSVIGDYRNYIAHDLVAYIDGKYRTIAAPASRGIAGHSMGGHGALSLSIEYPGVFGAVAALSPGDLNDLSVPSAFFSPEGFFGENPDGMGYPVLIATKENQKINPSGLPATVITKEQMMGYLNKQNTMIFYSVAAALSPNLDSPPYYADLPLKYPEKTVISERWEAWKQRDLVHQIAQHGDALVGKPVYVDQGTGKLVVMPEVSGVDRVLGALDAKGISYTYETFDGDHFTHLRHQTEAALKFMSKNLATSTKDQLAALNTGIGKAIDAHDVAAITGFMAPDAVFDFVSTPPVLTGTNAVGGFFAGLFQGFPDYTTTSEQRWISGNIVVTAHTTMATLNGAWMGLPATGKGGPHMHVDIWEYQGDKIQRTTTYADMQSIMVTVGLMPAPELPTLQPITGIPTPVPTGLAPLAAVIESQARWNAHDLAGLARMMRADSQVLVAMLGVPMDRRAFVALSELYFLAESDLKLEVVRHLDLGDGWVLSEVVFRGTNDGPYFGLPATGRAVKVRGAILYQVDNQGLLGGMQIYFDNITNLAQLGLFPPALPADTLAALNAGIGKAIDAHDVAGIVSYLAPDAVFDFVPAPSVMTGTNAIADFFVGLFHGYPDYTTVSEQRWVSGGVVVTAHSTTGTLQNEWMGLPPTGKDTNAPPHVHLDVWEYQGDKIQRITTYLDTQSLMIDLGLMPAPELPPLEPTTPLPDPVPSNLRPVSAIQEIQARWNAHDLPGVAKLTSVDSQTMMGPLQGAILDRKSFFAVNEIYFLGFNDLTFDITRNLDLGDGWVLSEGVYRGTQTGPYFGLPATGRPIQVRAAILRRINNQGIWTEMKVYFDNITTLTQLGFFPPAPAPGDLNSDSLPDLLFEDADGFVGYWSMHGASLSAAGLLEPFFVRDPAWKLVSLADFNSDSRPDLVFQHADSSLAVWLMQGTTMTASQLLDPPASGPDWQLVGVRDLDADGKPDLVFQHQDGSLAAWLMDGATRRTVSSLEPSRPREPGWRAVGTGNGAVTGRWELVFQHDDGTLALWSMEGLKLADACVLSPSHPSDPNWRVVAMADLDQDGKSDLLFEHRTKQALGVWFMDGCTARLCTLLDPATARGSWQIVGPK